ncbi:MAG: glycosyl hydrolase family 28-related protein [Alphaproteobacteria bacterium]
MSLDRVDLIMSMYRSRVAGAVARTGRDALDDAISVKTVGAVGNGSADDTDAIEEALNSGRRIRVPAGEYIITRKLSITDFVGMYGEGMERSNFIFDGCDGFEITTPTDTSDNCTTIFDHLSFKSTTDGVNTGIKLNGRSLDFGKQLLVTHCSFVGSDPSKCWQIPIRLTKGFNTEIKGCSFLGRHDSNDHYDNMAHAIYADDLTTDVKIKDNHIYMADIAILVSGNLYYDASVLKATNGGEGWTVADNHMVLVGTGFWSRDNGGNMFVLHGNHIAARKRGIILGTENVVGSNSSFIHDNFLMKRNDSTDNYVGIECNAADTKIHFNELRVEGSAASGGTETQIVVSGGYCSVIGNTVTDADTGIWLKGTAAHGTVALNKGGNNGVNLDIDAANVTRGLNAFDDEPAGPRGVRLHKNGDTSIGAGYSVIPFNVVVRDPENFVTGGRIYTHEACWVRIFGQVVFSATGSNYGHSVKLLRNGSGSWIGMPVHTAVGDGPVLPFDSGWILCAADEYFEVAALHGSPGVVNATTYSWVEMEIKA